MNAARIAKSTDVIEARRQIGDCVAQPYRLWSQARSWCDYELTTEPGFHPAIRSLFPAEWPGGGQQLSLEAQLISEPEGPRGPWSTSVRVDGRTIGYLGGDDARPWAGVLRRIVASGLIPTTSAQIYGYEYDGWDGIEFRPTVCIGLGDPEDAVPLNEPPETPYTMLPRSSFVQVTKEDEHFDVLANFVPPHGHGVLFVTLHEHPPAGKAKEHVEVRIDDARIGQLTPQMSQRFLPMIKHLHARGLITACWGDITGSAVAAEVRIDAVKANEATSDVLDGTPVTIPRLVPPLPDASLYDLSPFASMLKPLPFHTTKPAVPHEPPDGSVLRFEKGRGRYCYVAVRRGSHWETTATGNWGSINESMQWRDLAIRVRRFEIATGWSAVPHGDPRVREHRAVVRFTINGLYLAAVNVCENLAHEGDWYTTITEEAEQYLPSGDYVDWSYIQRYGQHIQVVTGWAHLI